MNISKFLITTGAFLLLAVIISACSVQVQNEEKSTIATMKVPGTAHTHPANGCTNSITHTHLLPGTTKVHVHRYSCKGKVPKSVNTHRHSANKCTKSTTHNHRNGRHAHYHKYACKPQAGNRGRNAHTHAANSLTRSMRHVHPGGNRRHNHHYSR